MVIENGSKASSSKASKGTKDRIKALEVSIYELRQNESDKNWQNVDKNIQVSLPLKNEFYFWLIGQLWCFLGSFESVWPTSHQRTRTFINQFTMDLDQYEISQWSSFERSRLIVQNLQPSDYPTYLSQRQFRFDGNLDGFVSDFAIISN
mgnify:FL=1